MDTFAERTTRIDVEHLGHRQVIAACLLESEDGPGVVDPGPASTLATLEKKLHARGVRLEDLRSLLLTHIHLDHAGATGTIVRRNPRARVYVHERGAPHLARPERLLESATRLYGDKMNELWGEFLPVPQENIAVLQGGERIRAGGRELDVEYTPGHAWHHVSYFDRFTGTAFTGDTTGIRISGRACLLPPTPPPDIDLEAWEKSLGLILAQKPARFFLTHFGPAAPVEEHDALLRESLRRWAELVRASLDNEASDEERAAQFVRDVYDDLKHKLTEEDARHYMAGATPLLCWYGLARYWRKRARAA